ncbi:MAG: valine--tRNA ligase [Nitrospiraceae bacterium]|nr:MAG: valine--tRNA ligase [Nitrospiraceae bacterium]
MEKSYDPKQVETRWYRTWSERGYFHASTAAEGRPYVIVIPPPNITGSLHMGHALNNTIQDILIRWRRMQGLNALWVPGTDHAGIATQNVVEKQLLAEGSSRDKLGRDRFIQRVWDWKAQSGGTIIEQLKRLGASCDWDRLRFTMDDGLSKAVREVFVRLHEDGLIYRGKRLINWCPRCLTALSDIEVEHEDTTGKLYHIRYPLADDPATHLTVATTRPETMLGDTAVAVHPEDPRYNRLIGKSIALPLTTRRIPIVGDPILVDREFGTGAVKITPAHDFNDFEAGLRHNLARLAVFDQHARMDASGLREAHVEEALRERLASQPVQKARTFVVEALEKGGFLVKVEDHAMALGKCYRCKTVVEPYLSPQWFVKIQPLAEPAIKAVESGQIRLIPEQWTNNYLGWMRDIKDWCISRQIWWGHQIPAWYCRNCNAEAILETTSPRSLTITSEAKPIVARTAPAHCPDCGRHDFVRDPDVLDTWFSSALWPFSTLGWPDQTPELKKFYPTSTLVTGFDILFFWVARMIMLGLKFMGPVPFKDVYIHALVRDAEGQKMSKSKGNVIDPLQVMDKYGTDALRFTLAAMASPGRDIKLSEERIEGYRNFANKLWNAARFILMNLEGPRAESPAIERSEDDRWIMSRLNRCISEVNAALEAYRFDEAANTLYQFIWHEYCDQYIERAKLALADKNSRQAASTRKTLLESFDVLLRLLHPFMPFITEEIWQAIPHTGASIMLASYPTPHTTLIDESIEKRHLWLQTVIANVASTTSANRITPSQGFSVVISSPNIEVVNFLRPYDGKIKALTRASEIQIGSDVPIPDTASANTVYIVNGEANVFVWPHSGAIDIAKEISRKEKRRSELNAQMEQDQKKLSNPDFVAKVPPDVLEKTKKRYEECRLEHEKLSGELKRLREMAGGSA